MPSCYQECVRIISRWGGWNREPTMHDPDCPPLTDDEAQDHVANEVLNHNNNHSIQEPGCGECECVPYASPQSGRPLRPRVERHRVQFVKDHCVYVIYFTVTVHYEVIPLGFCLPK